MKARRLSTALVADAIRYIHANTRGVPITAARIREFTSAATVREIAAMMRLRTAELAAASGLMLKYLPADYRTTHSGAKVCVSAAVLTVERRNSGGAS